MKIKSPLKYLCGDSNADNLSAYDLSWSNDSKVMKGGKTTGKAATALQIVKFPTLFTGRYRL